MKVEFSENNSGGGWWLSRAQYEAMFAAGWHYETSDYDIEKGYDDGVPYGWRHNTVGEFDTLRNAVEAFELATGEDFFAQGCPCCGVPFSMSSDNDYVSGNSVVSDVRRPW